MGSIYLGDVVGASVSSQYRNGKAQQLLTYAIAVMVRTTYQRCLSHAPSLTSPRRHTLRIVCLWFSTFPRA